MSKLSPFILSECPLQSERLRGLSPGNPSDFSGKEGEGFPPKADPPLAGTRPYDLRSLTVT